MTLPRKMKSRKPLSKTFSSVRSILKPSGRKLGESIAQRRGFPPVEKGPCTGHNTECGTRLQWCGGRHGNQESSGWKEGQQHRQDAGGEERHRTAVDAEGRQGP